MKERMTYYGSDERSPSRVLDYRDLINEQTRITSQILTFAISDEQVLNAERAVDVLESLIIRQTADVRYRKEMMELNKNHNKKLRSLPSKTRQANLRDLKMQYTLSKFRLIMLLLSRKGLSYIPEISIVMQKKKGQIGKKRKAKALSAEEGG